MESIRVRDRKMRGRRVRPRSFLLLVLVGEPSSGGHAGLAFHVAVGTEP